jgi:predicted unusual protein kinase regulating ubiquinone biosynthesis (AarF/ABC1/UbiB family)
MVTGRMRAQARLGCNSELILDEFGEKLLEELDYAQEARNIQARALQGAPLFNNF